MPATATAPARSPRTRARPASTASARLVPVAVGRTAVAVGGIADSGLMVRLTRGRLWIGLLATLLVGIVGLNVAALSFSARSSQSARKAEALEQRNSALRAQLANQLSHDELEAAAARLGLLTPAPDAINYVKGTDEQAQIAARRLRSGELTAADSAAIAVEPVVTQDAGAVATDTATAATELAAADTVSDPATAEPATTAPATDAAVDPATAAGAVVAP